MNDGAQRRSIDEIIGSIRSIMDRGNAPNSNDDVPDDLTELPSSPVHPMAYAEPTAPRPTSIDAAAFDHAVEPDADDIARMAEIARTVGDNIAEAEVRAVDPGSENPTFGDAAEDVLVDIAAPPAERPNVRSDFAPLAKPAFGRRGVPESELPVHLRLRKLHDSVASEHTVGMRGVTVHAANDPFPGESMVDDVPVDLPTVPPVAVAVPATLPAVQTEPPRAASDPQLDEAMLRPIIREWLDDNLPPLVERLVREELQKAIRGKRD